MGGKRLPVVVAANFDRNLDSLREFLKESPRVYDDLLDHLFQTVIPNLERFPDLGRDFLARAPGSSDVLVALDHLQRHLPADSSLREYIFGDHLVLYVRTADRIFLLSIRHHRQLSFDLRGHWTIGS